MATASRKAGRPLLLLSPSWGLAGAFVLVIRLGHRRGGKLRSFLSTRDCSQHIPSRGTSQGIRERLCPVVADTDLSGANSSPQGPLHPSATCGWLGNRLDVRFKPPHPRSHSSRPKREGSRAAVRQLGSNNLANPAWSCLLCCFSFTWACDARSRHFVFSWPRAPGTRHTSSFSSTCARWWSRASS